MRYCFGLSMLFLGLVATASFTQEVEVTTGKVAVNAGQDAGNHDRQIAAFLHNGCRNEVELSKFALPMLQSADAKEFAAMMVKEHQAACESLAKIAGPMIHTKIDPNATTREANREIREARREAREERREEAARTGQPAGKVEVQVENGQPRVEVSGAPGAPAVRAERVERAIADNREEGRLGLHWAAIHRQIADQCLASAQSELKQKEGKHVDDCYIGMQIGAHMKMIDELKVLSQSASPEFRSELDKSLETANTHLKEAKRIMEASAKETASGKSL